jgi:hypothetical protein
MWTIARFLVGFIIIFIIFESGTLYNNQWNNRKTITYKVLHKYIWSKTITAENVERHHHKLLIWIAAYDTTSKRDQYVVQHLAMARNICESFTPNSFVRLFIATRSQNWNTTDSLRKFRIIHSYKIIYMTDTNSSNDFLLIEHFKWSCVEFMIGYYKRDVGFALPFQHRKYFQEHVNEFDWFWFTEEDLLYDNHTYWKLVEDTSFAFNTLSSNQTNNLLKLYAEKARKPRLSPFGRYFFLPTLMRFEKPPNYTNNSAIQLPDILDLWRLTDLFFQESPGIEAFIFYNEQWWVQPMNSHTGYYLLPREHLQVITKDRNWLGESNIGYREFVSSFWLYHYGYIRVTSITKFNQYLVHHASNRYYDDPHYHMIKASILTRTLGFEYKKDHFSPTKNLTDSHLLDYTDRHDHDMASCFPLSFVRIPNRTQHEATHTCAKLLKINKIN